MPWGGRPFSGSEKRCPHSAQCSGEQRLAAEQWAGVDPGVHRAQPPPPPSLCIGQGSALGQGQGKEIPPELRPLTSPRERTRSQTDACRPPAVWRPDPSEKFVRDC